MAEYGSGDGRWFVRPTELPTLNFRQFKPHLTFNAGGHYSNYGKNIHRVGISTYDPSNKKSEEMGHIEWSKTRGEILNVNVDEPYRRMGVANTLFHEAKNIARQYGLKEPVHSSDRTDMGDVWAKQAGGKIPPRKRLTSPRSE